MRTASFALIFVARSIAAADCSADASTTIGNALSDCAAAVGLQMIGMPWLQLVSYLRTNESLVRADFCSKNLSPQCDALASLPSNSNVDCQIWLYKGTTFNPVSDVPKFCAVPYSTAVEVTFYGANEKVLSINDGKLLMQPQVPGQKNPTFVYNITSHLVQSGDKCVDAFPKHDNKFAVHLWSCSETNHNQFWRYEPARNRLKHLHHDNLCLDADPLDEGHVTVQPCHDLEQNSNQYFTIDNPSYKTIAYEYDKDFSAQDYRNYPALSPSTCVSVCQFDQQCSGFSWYLGVCYLKQGAGVFNRKNGVVSSKLDKCNNLMANTDISGHDIGSASGAKEDCCNICKHNSDCRAFSWSSYNGGTCWLKSSSDSIEWKADTWAGWV